MKMTRQNIINDLETSLSYLKRLVVLIEEEFKLRQDIEEFIEEVEESLEDEDEEEEETKPVIQIATSNPYVEKALSVLEGFLGKMGDSSNANSWPTEVRLRAAELILNYHKE